MRYNLLKFKLDLVLQWRYDFKTVV